MFYLLWLPTPLCCDSDIIEAIVAIYGHDENEDEEEVEEEPEEPLPCFLTQLKLLQYYKGLSYQGMMVHGVYRHLINFQGSFRR